MKPVTTLIAVAVLLGVAGTATAQPGVGLTAPTPEGLERRPPRYERGDPNHAGYDAGGRGVYYAPVFVGPTVRGETTEIGFSAWIAPNTPIGLQPGGGDAGWAAFGLTFSWGGPPRRPSAGTAIR